MKEIFDDYGMSLVYVAICGGIYGVLQFVEKWLCV